MGTSSFNSSIVRKLTNDFSYSDTALALVNNQDFKVGDHDIYKLRLNAIQTDTKYSYIWSVLSAVSDDISEKLYENIYNYIDNVANIDLCKVKSLLSMIKLVGANYSIFDDIKYIPSELLDMIDVFSIKTEYLLNSEKISEKLIEYLKDNNIEVESRIKDNIEKLDNLTILSYIDKDNLDTIISSCYYNTLTSNINLTYNDENETLIYKDLSSTILLSSFNIDDDEEIRELITASKILNNIPTTFDEIEIVNNIELGKKNLTDYNVAEQEILKIEIKRRQLAFNNLELSTRNKYYKLKKVKNYFNFIEYEYNKNLFNYESAKKYTVDEQYLSFENVSTIGLLDNDANIRNDMVEYAALNLLKITNTIRNIRDKLKSLSLKNFMKGTFILLNYVINEYLADNTIPNLSSNYLSHYSPEQLENDIALIETLLVEYIDPTDYFNIRTIHDDEDANVSDRFFETGGETEQTKPKNTTNIFEPITYVKGKAGTFSSSELSNFYLNTLKTTFDNLADDDYQKNLYSFLSSVYESGALKTTFEDGKTIVDISCIRSIDIDDIIKNYLKYGKFSKYENDSLLELILKIPIDYLLNNNTVNAEKQEYLDNFSILSNSINVEIDKIEDDIADMHKIIDQKIFDNTAYCNYENINEKLYNKLVNYADYARTNSTIDSGLLAKINTISSTYDELIYTYDINDKLQIVNELTLFKNTIDGKITNIINKVQDERKNLAGIDYTTLMLNTRNLLKESSYKYKNDVDKIIKNIQPASQNINKDCISIRSQVSLLSTNIESDILTLSNLIDVGLSEFKLSIQDKKQLLQSLIYEIKNLDKTVFVQGNTLVESLMSEIAKDNGKLTLATNISIVSCTAAIVSVEQAMEIADDNWIELGSLTGIIFDDSILDIEAEYLYKKYNEKTSKSKVARGWLRYYPIDVTIEQSDNICVKINKYIAITTGYFPILAKDATSPADFLTKAKLEQTYIDLYDLSEVNAIRNGLKKLTDTYNSYLYQINDLLPLKYKNYVFEYLAELLYTEVNGINILTYADIEERLQDSEEYLNSLVEKMDEYTYSMELSSMNYNLQYINNVLDNCSQLSNTTAIIDNIIAKFNSSRSLYDQVEQEYKYIQNSNEFLPQQLDYAYNAGIEYGNNIGQETYDSLKDLSSDRYVYLSSNLASILINNGISSLEMNVEDEDFSINCNIATLYPIESNYIEDQIADVYTRLDNSNTECISLFDSTRIEYEDSVKSIISNRLQLYLSVYLSSIYYDTEDINSKMAELSNALSSKYYNDLLLLAKKYGSTLTADTPFYYILNDIHPSYQIHPFLSSFIEKDQFNYNIDDVASMSKDEIVAQIKTGLDEYVDEDGYSINIWKNPTNVNFEYLSRYEKMSHKDITNLENPVFLYDGLFYPTALYLFFNSTDTDFEITRQYGYELNGEYKQNGSYDFYEALVGVEESNWNCFNPWYSGLDLSIEERRYIKEQLEQYRTYLFRLMHADEVNDIYKYAIDIYGNYYILVKQYPDTSFNNALINIDDIDVNVKNNTAGILWIRFKNHPIAFPAIAYDNKYNYLNISLVSECINSYGNEKMKFATFTEISIKSGKSVRFPNVFDMTISDIKDTILLNCCLDADTITEKQYDNSTSIIINIDKVFSEKDKRYVLNFECDNSSDKTEYLTAPDFSEDFAFKGYINIGKYLGSIYLKNNESAVSIYIVYYAKGLKHNIKSLTYDYTLEYKPYGQILVDSCFIDLHSTLLSLAYIRYDSIDNNAELTNVYGKSMTFSEITSKKVEVNDHNISTKDFIILEDYIIEKEDIEHLFNTYVDEGFYPLITNPSNVGQYEKIYSNLAMTDRLKKFNIVKFLLLGDETSKGIDFKFTLQGRLYEGYEAVKYDDIDFAKYKDIHYYEDDDLQAIQLTDNVYSPYELNKLLGNSKITFKVDENFAKLGYIDKYALTPWLILSASADREDTYYNGKATTALTATTNNLAIFSIYRDDTLSVTWKHNSDGEIKLDFNTYYYNNGLKQNGIELNNTYGKYHTFLNLDKPGMAGYLITYDCDFSAGRPITRISEKHVYYIKNISTTTTKPLFLISCDTNELTML